MDEDDNIPEGESITIEGEVEDPTAVELEDGGVLLDLEGDEAQDAAVGEWFANLAETLPESTTAPLATSLLDLIEIDKNSRKKRDELYAEGLRRTGLSDDAPGGAQFQGATKTVHPMLVEGCVDFSSRVMKELFPRGGPVKDYVPGKLTEAKIAKASRKVQLMNWQLTKQCKEFRAELEQLVTQVPLGGDQYLKVSWDEGRNRPEFLFVGIDEMYLPFAATNFYTAQRRTHVQYLTKVEFDRRVANGMYRDLNVGSPGMEPDMSAATKANDKIEGRDDTSYNEDGLRTIYEVFTIADIEPEYGPAPYIVSIDLTSTRVLSVYRNWMEDDATKEELQHFVQFPFIPWRGAYSIGLTHMIGSLSGAATGALRALLDSAHIQNAPSALKLKGGKIGGQQRTPQPGEVLEIEGGFAVDDIRKIAMPMPFNGPSPTLFSLLQFIVDAGKGVVRTALDDLPDMQGDVPVGTTMARIEQGLVVFSAIHGRMHDAMDRLLDILHRLNGLYLDDEGLKEEVGEEIATRADFQGPKDVCPVSDPNIFSETQRIVQAQTVAQRADLKPQLYDLRKVEELLLRTLKIPNADSYLVPSPTPKEMNAANENTAASLGRPITAFPEQDHVQHIRAHMMFMQTPWLGGLPTIAPRLLPVMMGHLTEHAALWYSATVFQMASEALGMDLGELMREMSEEGDSEERRALDAAMAEATDTLSWSIAVASGQIQMPPGAQPVEVPQEILSLPQVLQQAQQQLQQMQPAMPPDPIIALENRKIDEKAKTDAARLQQDAQESMARLQIEQQRVALDAQDSEADRQAKLAMNAADNQSDEAMNAQDNATAMQLAVMGSSRGTNPNPNPRP